MSVLIVAVDGPAAAGKGTLAKALADVLGLPHLDTGLLYRAVARRMILEGLDPQRDDGEALARRLDQADLARADLRVPEIDRGASGVATQPGVRAALLQRQRDFARASGGVIDGRDIGTVVFPDASVKLFVTASPRTRALRRFRQLHGDAPLSDAGLTALTDDIAARDRQDETRPVSPLKRAEDAVVIETDALDSAAVLARALEIVRASQDETR
ncbi:(d)CMP kinase [Acidomonas methanolica]|uniref:Cytidylate kinase n=1 Tax=Acidomonas methanolica NBRC 104435 TaxID=1231351 RepID=A0A023D0M9_ACIMT|nr:(d)CMP kinase [Acidomonas methanolica]TCS32256.1 cytidylate kinase [Acidomonas methanolica]GAJ27629.1 cytidylate kinase [Acidomonas methanolica NBRC 104435]GBQ54377.1 cytidylate kinase [Acidomonas methanolica]GEK97691.1 cytidylate kinase [Acidomonas methanolica NBRC 104435]